MPFSDKTFAVLDALDQREIFNQRQLAEHTGISLGQVNYILRSLLERGFVKITNFRKNPHKISYVYLLTPKGIKTKSRLAVKFLTAKLVEYENLRKRLAEKLTAVERSGHIRIIFVGPETVENFMQSIIREKNLRLVRKGHCQEWTELTNVRHDSFDVALLLESTKEKVSKISDATGVPSEKLLPLW